jgi:hypothetical protein
VEEQGRKKEMGVVAMVTVLVTAAVLGWGWV